MCIYLLEIYFVFQFIFFFFVVTTLYITYIKRHICVNYYCLFFCTVTRSQISIYSLVLDAPMPCTVLQYITLVFNERSCYHLFIQLVQLSGLVNCRVRDKYSQKPP